MEGPDLAGKGSTGRRPWRAWWAMLFGATRCEVLRDQTWTPRPTRPPCLAPGALSGAKTWWRCLLTVATRP
eukprot:14541479-Alexandrium_andersonii.AAC.1